MPYMTACDCRRACCCDTCAGMKGWVFLLPTVTPEDAKTYFPEHKVCEVPSGKGETAFLHILLARTCLALSAASLSLSPPYLSAVPPSFHHCLQTTCASRRQSRRQRCQTRLRPLPSDAVSGLAWVLRPRARAACSSCTQLYKPVSPAS